MQSISELLKDSISPYRQEHINEIKSMEHRLKKGVHSPELEGR